MNKPTICALAIALALASGCARNRIQGPTPLDGDMYIIASYSKALSAEKVKMLQKANAFCEEKGGKMKVHEITVVDRRTGMKTAVAVAETIVSPVGNIEMTFTCERTGK